MSLSLDENNAAYQIRAYQPGSIQINDIIWHQSLIISSSEIFTEWPPQRISDLKKEHFHNILTLKPALLILGTGATLIFPPIEIYGELLNKGIGVEIMDTRAACRTYSALSAENREVIAALIIE